MEGYSSVQLWMMIALPLLTSLVVTYLLFKFAPNLKIFAPEDHRRKQTQSTPLLGGLGIHAGTLITLLLISVSGSNPHGISFGYLLLALLFTMFVGVADDRFEIDSKAKFLGQNIIAFSLLLAIRGIETPIQHYISDHPIVVLAIQWFWIMGLLNSMNLIDGLDGLASGIGIITLGFLNFLYWEQTGHVSPYATGATLSILGFYFWNRHPARIYLGESGSMLVGIHIFVASMVLNSNSTSFFTIAAPILATGVPALDTLVAIIRRARRRTSLGTGDRDHIHHRLLRLGISHKFVVRIVFGLTAYLCLLSYSLFGKDDFSALNASVAVLGILIIVFLLVALERKLYTYLKNFGNQMLQVMDTQNYGAITSYIRMENLRDQGIKFKAYKLNLDSCIQELLISSCGRVHTFYTDLAGYVRNNEPTREVYFENSTSVLIIHKLLPGASENFMRDDLLEELRNFEGEFGIDLYLKSASTLQEVSAERLSTPVTRADSRKFGRRRTDRTINRKLRG